MDKSKSKDYLPLIETGQFSVVKFGNRSYRIPAGEAIEQLRQAGYDHLMESKNRG